MSLQGGRPANWSQVLDQVARAQPSSVYLPAAIWVALDLIEEGAAPGGRLLFVDFEPRLASLLQRAGLAGHDTAWLPFWQLGREVPLWRLRLHGESAPLPDAWQPRSRTELLRGADAAQLHPELLAELAAPAGTQRVREQLLAVLLHAADAEPRALGRALKPQGPLLCRTAVEVARSLGVFNREAASFADRSREVLRTTQYWVWSPDTDGFGPGKFVGYHPMSFSIYERARAGTAGGDRFDGHVSKSAIGKALGDSFAPSRGLSLRLKRWAHRLLGHEVLVGVSEAKWKFIRLPARQKYWGLMVSPAHYDIDAAVRALDLDAWTVPHGELAVGDRVAVWRTPATDRQRGIVALAEILAPPELRPDRPQSQKYWKTAPTQKAERRVLLRYVLPPKLPLWLAAETEALMSPLSVLKEDGSAVCQIEPEDWWRLLDALGGWPEAPGERPEISAVLPNGLPRHRVFLAAERADAKEGSSPDYAGRTAGQGRTRGEAVGSVADALADLTVGERIGNFRLVRSLGEGGMGRVFLAQHTQINRQVAIKLLLPKFRYSSSFFTRFKKEADLLVKLQHPGVVSIYDFGWYPPEEPTIPYMVMEYLQGETLASLIGRSPDALSPPKIISYAQQICAALAAIHGAGVIHRDLKPSNIMIVPPADPASGGRAVLIDFGVAKEPSSESAQRLTNTGEPVGTVQYMSPEQLRDASSVAPATDIYSFGQTLYELMTKQPPNPSMAASRLRDLIIGMTALIPSARPTASEVAAELQKISAVIVP